MLKAGESAITSDSNTSEDGQNGNGIILSLPYSCSGAGSHVKHSKITTKSREVELTAAKLREKGNKEFLIDLIEKKKGSKQKLKRKQISKRCKMRLNASIPNRQSAVDQ